MLVFFFNFSYFVKILPFNGRIKCTIQHGKSIKAVFFNVCHYTIPVKDSVEWMFVGNNTCKENILVVLTFNTLCQTSLGTVPLSLKLCCSNKPKVEAVFVCLC